jgi:class 3 adenylate cyclase
MLIPAKPPMSEETASTLPQVLRRFGFVRALLEPSARIQGIARELYPIRMTLGIVGVILFIFEAAQLAALDETALALWVALGAVPMLLGATQFLRLGWPRLAVALGITGVFGFQLLIHLTYGPGAGAWLFSLPLAMAIYQVHAPEDWPHRLPPVVYAFVGIVLPIAFPDLPPRRHVAAWQLHVMFSSNLVGTLYALLVVSSHAAAVRDHARAEVGRQRDRADALLRNILPEPIVRRLQSRPGIIADAFAQVTVVFGDIVGFTQLSAQLSSEELVLLLNELFSAFDALAARHGLEKIKTIGDAYMVVSGLPEPRPDHAEAAVRMALDMRAAVAALALQRGLALDLRIGVHSGSVVAGVIGVHKFAYDLWGDTVNTASRMESHGAPGLIHISDATRALLPPGFDLEERGEIAVKGKGEMRTWFVRG